VHRVIAVELCKAFELFTVDGPSRARDFRHRA
jgi:hypothetical protein